MFKELYDNGTLAGFMHKQGDRLFFFGTGHTGREDLHRLFPHFEFCFLKQVHGRAVIPAQAGAVPEADGHFTSQPGLALVAQSADCMPVLLSSSKRVCAVHAGWRGMALNIIGAAKERMPDLEFVALGPHILRDSFEIGADVAEQLMAAAPARDESLFKKGEAQNKFYFDLKRLAEIQLGMPFSDCCLDTKTNPLFHSYRRGKSKTDRQYSFVVIAPELR
jgi:YfiH family protein